MSIRTTRLKKVNKTNESKKRKRNRIYVTHMCIQHEKYGDTYDIFQVKEEIYDGNLYSGFYYVDMTGKILWGQNARIRMVNAIWDLWHDDNDNV